MQEQPAVEVRTAQVRRRCRQSVIPMSRTFALGLIDTYEKFAAAYCAFLEEPGSCADDKETQAVFRATYDAKLLDGYETYARSPKVQNCSGDSGGPLLRITGGRMELVGVASAVGVKSDDQYRCAFGTAFVLPMAPKVRAFARSKQ